MPMSVAARLLVGGRIEVAFARTDGERILPASRYFPVVVGFTRWLRSREIDLGG